jgi:hypothetical protein
MRSLNRATEIKKKPLITIHILHSNYYIHKLYSFKIKSRARTWMHYKYYVNFTSARIFHKMGFFSKFLIKGAYFLSNLYIEYMEV